MGESTGDATTLEAQPGILTPMSVSTDTLKLANQVSVTVAGIDAQTSADPMIPIEAAAAEAFLEPFSQAIIKDASASHAVPLAAAATSHTLTETVKIGARNIFSSDSLSTDSTRAISSCDTTSPLQDQFEEQPFPEGPAYARDKTTKIIADDRLSSEENCHSARTSATISSVRTCVDAISQLEHAQNLSAKIVLETRNESMHPDSTHENHEIHTTEDEASEREDELAIPNFQISEVNPEWQKLMEDLEAQKANLKGKKKIHHQGQRKSVRLKKNSR